MLARKLRILAVVPVFALLFQGCVNEEGTYNDFLARQKALQEGGVSEAGPDGEAGPCTPPGPGDINGKFLFVMSAKVANALQPPLLFLADVKTVAYSGTNATYKGGTGLQVSLQALSASDRKTPVGPTIDLPQMGIGSDGTIEPKVIPQITVTGAADPLVPGTEIVASNISLIGHMCGVQDFYCGTFNGKTSKPLAITLDGSPFALSLVPDPSKLPPDPIYVNCAKDTAPPLKSDAGP